MRIAFVVPSLGLQEGQGTANLELLRRVARAGHRVDVFTSNAPDIVRTMNGVRLHKISRLPKWQLGNQLIMLASATTQLRPKRYDIVHADAGVTLRNADVLVCHTVSDRWWDLPEDVWREPGLRGRHADAATHFKAWLEVKQFRAARAVIANSQMTADDLVARGVERARVTVMPFGVDSERFRPPTPAERATARASLSIPADAYVVLFVGPHGPRKGLPLVLETLHADEHLLVAGDVRGGRSIADARRRGLRATMPGKLDDVRRAYWSADVLAYPSRYDAFGMAVLEAMACGLPVIVSKTAGSHEIVTDAGFVLSEHTPRALREALDAIRTDPQRARAMGSRAREIARGRNWDTAGAIMLARYEELSDPPKGRATSVD